MKETKKLNKLEIEKEIKQVFSKNQNQKDIKKIKKLAMSKNLKLGSLRKKFCKKCYCFFDSKNSQTRIKKGFKTIKCKKCNYVSKWRVREI
jgi:RNase P subunit RPR2